MAISVDIGASARCRLMSVPDVSVGCSVRLDIVESVSVHGNKLHRGWRVIDVEGEEQ